MDPPASYHRIVTFDPPVAVCAGYVAAETTLGLSCPQSIADAARAGVRGRPSVRLGAWYGVDMCRRVCLIKYALIALALGGPAAEAVPFGLTTREEVQMAADASAGRIEGQVTIRPVRSVERRGVSNQQPYQASIAVLDMARREVARVQSDAEGRFELRLPPGSYVLKPESPGLYPRASEQRVVVRSNATARVEIVYDSGMR